MVAHVLRLRLALLFGAVRGDRAQSIRNVIGALLLIAATVAVCTAILSLRADSGEVAHVVSVLAGSALAFGAAVGPAVGGVEDQLAPRRFAVFGISSVPLAGALLLGMLVSLPSLALLAVAVSLMIMWTSQGVSAAVAVVTMLVAYLSCLVVSRLSMAVAARFGRDRRSREMTGLLVLALVIVIVPVVVFLGSLQWRGVVPSQLVTLTEILASTPFGAPWGIAGNALRGDSALLAGVLIAVGTLILLVGAWFLVVRHALSTTERPQTGRERGLGWFSVLPGNAIGAVAARSLVYWTRDRRYIVNVAVVPIASVIAALPLLVAGVPPQVVALVPVPIMALFLGWMPHNDIAYDSTAIWLHIVSGVRGLADRIGRLVPIVLIALPLLAIAITVSIALYGRWSMLPALVGVALCLFLTGLGLSSISSVVSPYPVTRPGDSPFQQPQRAGSGIGAQALVLIGAILLSSPALAAALRAIDGDLPAAMETLWIGLGMGVGVLAVGVALGAFLFERQGSRIMEFAEAI
ncbi:hypothetical protein [Microbacterium sp. ZW T5_56]|uniref:hypothetical protein n=1 Tax=Microbacterium sp. ZW T5_56 TaxID=3378081 RepID=UPI0038526070